ncbi:MAG: oligosaccharide flippase family protein [Candidatus Brocadiaceae bacterium]|nr:oligosaccharide flippase family protein [Candidatus Brocadiaceae bacterium]
MNINRKKILSDSIALSIGEFLIRFKGLIFIPIIVKSVGLDNYGAFIQILINKQIVVPFATLALGLSFYRYTSKYKDEDIDELSRDYWSVIIVSFILAFVWAVVLYLTSPLISKYVLAGMSLSSLKLSSLFVITGCLWVQTSKYIASRKHFKLYSVYRIIYQLVPYSGFLCGILIKKDLYSGMFYYMIIESIIVFVLMILVMRKLKIVLPDFSRVVKFVKYSWALIFSEMTGGLLSKVDKYFIGYFLGPAAIGIYNMVYSVCGLLYVLSEPFRKYNAMYLPELWDAGNYDMAKIHVRKSLIYYSVVSVGALLGIVFFLKPVMGFIFQKDLFGNVDCELLVLVTGIAIFLYGISTILYSFINLNEKTYLRLVFALIGLMVNMALNFLLIETYGIIGASIATLAAYSLILALSYFCTKEYIGHLVFFKISKIFILGLFIALLFVAISIDTILVSSIKYVIGFILYFYFVHILKIVDFHALIGKFKQAKQQV